WNGGAPRQLTRTPKTSEWQARFAPDGKSLLYLSDGAKDETTQLWRLTGKSARQITKIPGGIHDFDLSPDGKRAVVVADVGRNVGNTAENPPPIETERFQFKQDGDGWLD